MSLNAFIDDGYTESTSIAEEPGVYPEIRFTFRPMMASETAAFNHAIKHLTAVEERREAAKRLAAHIISWDVKKPGAAESMPITAENILRLKSPAFSMLLLVVSCQMAGVPVNLEEDLKN